MQPWRQSSNLFRSGPEFLADAEGEVGDRCEADEDADDQVDAFEDHRSDRAEGANPDGAVLQENGG